jgi:HSP20 family molecular chaperone IbpA
VSRIPVEKVHGSDASRIAEDTQALTGQIRQLAFHLFESRGYAGGHDLDDWLAAEQELVVKPEPEVTERNGRFEIRLPLSGFEAPEIRVIALPASLVIKGKTQGDKTLLRTIDLPDTIDVDKTVARVDKGVLYVTAVRQHAPVLA